MSAGWVCPHGITTFKNICTVACSLTFYDPVLTPVSIESFSCIAATVTAQLYQRNLPSSGTRWKEEHCGISRYRHIIMSLVFTCNSVKYVVSEGVCLCVCVCVSSSRTAPPWPSSRHVPPWTWSWISRPAGRVRGSWWRSWAHWGSWSCDWKSRRPGRTRSCPTGPWGTSASAACSERPRDRLDWKHSI